MPAQGPDQWAAQTGFTVLVAKVLTPSDANSGRIILPRTMVEANLNFVMGYRSPLPPSLLYSIGHHGAHPRFHTCVWCLHIVSSPISSISAYTHAFRDSSNICKFQICL